MLVECKSSHFTNIYDTYYRSYFSPVFNTHIKKLTQNQIDNVLSCCYVSKTKVLSHINSDTTILCSHRKDVNKYNDLIIHKMFHVNEIFDVMMETNAMGVEHVKNWLHDSKFDHIRYLAIGARIMITKNINVSKGAMNGAFAIVTSITFNNDTIITSITIKIISTNLHIMLKMTNITT